MNKTICCKCRPRRIWIWFIVIILHIIYSRHHDQQLIGSSSSSNSMDGQRQLIDDTKQLIVYKPTNSTSNVALCVMVKNETLYLDEFVDFHYALGFSPIIIYDNSDDFDLMYGLHPFDEYAYRSWYESREDIHEHLRLIHYPTLNEKFPHHLSQVQCIKQDAANSTFVSLFDADEFLVLKNFDNVADFADHYCGVDCGQLSINWKIMGISGAKQYTPTPLTKRNVHWNPGPDSWQGYVKPILRPSYVSDNTGHIHKFNLKKGNWLDTTGQRPIFKCRSCYQNTRNPTDVAVFYHYALRSEGEFYYKTCLKKRYEKESRCNLKGYYTLYNGTMFDDLAWQQLARMVPKYGRMYGQAIDNVTTFEPSELYTSWLKSQSKNESATE